MKREFFGYRGRQGHLNSTWVGSNEPLAFYILHENKEKEADTDTENLFTMTSGGFCGCSKK